MGASWLKYLGKPLWVVVDGAYAKAPFLMPAMSLGMTVVSRLRKDAALWTVPGPRVAGRQAGRGSTEKTASTWPSEPGSVAAGRPRLRTLRQAGEEAVQNVRGDMATRRRPHPCCAGRRAERGVAFFCTDANATVAEILATVADRFSLEITFRDCKEIVGAGQQQVRFVWANIGAFHICLWTFTMTEAWAWGRAESDLVDRKESPWDDPDRA